MNLNPILVRAYLRSRPRTTLVRPATPVDRIEWGGRAAEVGRDPDRSAEDVRLRAVGQDGKEGEVSDGYIVEGGVKRCNGCTSHKTRSDGYGGDEHICHHPVAKAILGPRRIGVTDHTPRWCPWDAKEQGQ